MRTLRTRTVGILTALVVMLWAGSASASTISFIWISASGGSGVGTPTLTGLSPADTAVLEIRWTAQSPTSGIGGAGIRATYDPSVVVAIANAPCPATPNNFFGTGAVGGSCGAFGDNIGGAAGFLTSLTSTFNGPGGLGAQTGTATAAGNATSGLTNGAFFELAHITFSAVGPGTTGASFFLPGVDGQIPIGGGFSFPTAVGTFSVDVIPEPGTFGMLALGLGALAFAGRRR